MATTTATTTTTIIGEKPQSLEETPPPLPPRRPKVSSPPKDASPSPPSSSRPSSAGTSTGSTKGPKLSVEINKAKPEDFEGEVVTNDDLPTQETLLKIQDYVVLDRHGKSRTFKSLYSGRNVARRVLLIFVRHFFCGNCQEYLRSLSESVTPDMLLGLPVSTFIAVVGCGDPGLIDMYVTATGCPFPVYTDPTRSIFDALGMVRTLALGARPAYARRSLAKGIMDSIVQGIKQIPKGLVTRGGDQRQVGGEFLFEPLTAATPLVGAGFPGADGEGKVVHDEEQEEDAAVIEEKRVTWCHRMRSTRDHAEVPELMEILGLDGQGKPAKDKKRWDRALETRKGTGVTLAKEMSEMSELAGRDSVDSRKRASLPASLHAEG